MYLLSLVILHSYVSLPADTLLEQYPFNQLAWVLTSPIPASAASWHGCQPQDRRIVELQDYPFHHISLLHIRFWSILGMPIQLDCWSIQAATIWVMSLFLTGDEAPKDPKPCCHVQQFLCHPRCRPMVPVVGPNHHRTNRHQPRIIHHFLSAPFRNRALNFAFQEKLRRLTQVNAAQKAQVQRCCNEKVASTVKTNFLSTISGLSGLWMRHAPSASTDFVPT